MCDIHFTSSLLLPSLCAALIFRKFSSTHRTLLKAKIIHDLNLSIGGTITGKFGEYLMNERNICRHYLMSLPAYLDQDHETVRGKYL